MIDCINCENCNRLHKLDSRDYVTFQGAVTIGESKPVTPKTVRLCAFSDCLSQMFRLISEINPQRPEQAPIGLVGAFAGKEVVSTAKALRAF